jgi:hypothetical protein
MPQQSQQAAGPISKNCPKCGLTNPASGLICDCGFNFDTGALIRKPGVEVKPHKPEQVKLNSRLAMAYGWLSLIAGMYLLLTTVVSLVTSQQATPPPVMGGRPIGVVAAAFQGLVLLATGIAVLMRNAKATALVWAVTILSGLGVVLRGIIPVDFLLWLLQFAFALWYWKHRALLVRPQGQSADRSHVNAVPSIEPNASELKKLESSMADLAAPKRKSTKWHYISLCFFLLIFFILIGLTLFLVVSGATFPLAEKAQTPNVVPLLFLILAISADWKAILNREPPAEARFRRRHKNVLVVVASLLVAIVLGATITGIRNGHNREKVHKIEALYAEAMSAGEVGTKVSAIKNRELKTTTDYEDAYNEIDRLLPEWKKHLQSASSALAEVRGYHLDDRTSSILAVDSAAIDLGRQGIELTEKEVAVINEMSRLPPSEQVAFWVENFQPLQSDEAGLIGRRDALMGRLKAEGNK